VIRVFAHAVTNIPDVPVDKNKNQTSGVNELVDGRRHRKVSDVAGVAFHEEALPKRLIEVKAEKKVVEPMMISGTHVFVFLFCVVLVISTVRLSGS
jgi:hypothetical protein